MKGGEKLAKSGDAQWSGKGSEEDRECDGGLRYERSGKIDR